MRELIQQCSAPVFPRSRSISLDFDSATSRAFDGQLSERTAPLCKRKISSLKNSLNHNLASPPRDITSLLLRVPPRYLMYRSDAYALRCLCAPQWFFKPPISPLEQQPRPTTKKATASHDMGMGEDLDSTVPERDNSEQKDQ